MKELIKNIITFFYCFIYGIKKHKKLYIGLHCKFVNGKNINLKKGVSIMPYTMLCAHGESHITFSDGSRIGMFSRVAALNNVSIGKNVIIGPNAFIADYNHEYRDVKKSIKDQGNNYISNGKKNKVVIEDETWIGTNVVVVGNVHIGKHCVVGANTVVTHDIEDYCVVAGNPSRVIKKYNWESEKWEKI